ncbi:3-hydroxybutyrate dehydrogenase [Falsiroseomonas sp. HW251]|uniref:3-hydroxybutyrate dehydrogenase n=1 Tax=Falsiroseomonas sp. HW251 TaxID=3390998 RepID=UPI003D314D02
MDRFPCETATMAVPGAQLSGRIALVTGSTRGIGFGIAKALYAAGCDVMLSGRGEEGEQVAEHLARSGERGRVGYAAADLREHDAATALLAACSAQLGEPDILVNNAGVQHVAPVACFPDERWDEIIALNLSAAFRLSRSVLHGMRRRGWGRIVNIASVHGLVASEGKCAYVAAKHGLLGLTKTVALEVAGDGITCNAICPGWVRTELVERQIERIAAERGVPIEDAASELLRAKQPMRRFSTPEGIGDLVAFLCGEKAATMTGSAITMDGGWVSI